MKAVVIESFGGPEVLQVREDVAVPAPGPGEVQVKVRACAVCYLDTIVRRGMRPNVTLPLIPGHEICGTITSLGVGVQGFSEGDRVASTFRGVCGHCWYCRTEQSAFCLNVRAAGVDRDGGYAEYVVLPVSSLALVPDGVSDEAATMAGCVLGAVYKGVRVKGRVGLGDTALVTGAGGGAGIHATQLASRSGARVLAVTGSPEKKDAIRAAGAAEVLIGSKEEILDRVMAVTDGRGVEVVLDCVGQPTSSLSLRALARGGRLVFIGEVSTEPTRISVARMLYQETEIHGVASPNAGELAIVLDLIRSGQLEPKISEVMSLDQAAAAHETVADRSKVGKIVLRP